MSKVNDTPKPRNFNVQPFERPTGYDKRMTREMPREAADNSGYEERIYQCSDKLASRFTGEPADENLLERVKDIRTVAQTAGHKVSDYKGESPWFIKAVLTDTADQNRCITLTLASGKNFKAVANDEGEYYNSLEYCNDNLTWNTLPLNTDITPYAQQSGVSAITVLDTTAARDSSEDTDGKIASTGEDAHFYAWGFTEQGQSAFIFTTTASPVVGSPVYMRIETTYFSYTADVSAITASTTNLIWLRGRILQKGGVCPKFSGNADAITKVEGDLSSLLDFRASTLVAPKTGSFSNIFAGCTALTDASGLIFPTVAPNGTHAYGNMFEGCTALTAAPDLSQVPLTKNATFIRMFKGCTALVTAPNLPRVDVVPWYAYQEMFYGCTHLSSITIHVGSRNAGDGFRDWMYNAGTSVNGTCTFYHSEDTFRWIYPSISGIPNSSIQLTYTQKDWTPNPALTTRLYFGSETSAGTVVAQAGSAYISSGDPVNIGTSMTVTPSAPAGYVFESWVKKPAGASEASETHVLTFNMPYSRYDETDKIECVARFRNTKNLCVVYELEGSTTHLAFSRYTTGDDTQAGQTMFAWTPGDVTNTTLMTGIGLIYTDTLEPIVGTPIYKKDASGQWFSSDAHFEEVEGSIWTDNVTVIIFDNATTYSYSLRIVVGGRTYSNMYKSFCALTAPTGTDNLVVTVYQQDGTPFPNGSNDIHWSDDTTATPHKENPRTFSVTSLGICLSRDAN